MRQPSKKLQWKEEQFFLKASGISSSLLLPFLPSECFLRSLWCQQLSQRGVRAGPSSPYRHQWGSLSAYLCIEPKLKILLREEISCQPISQAQRNAGTTNAVTGISCWALAPGGHYHFSVLFWSDAKMSASRGVKGPIAAKLFHK